MSVDGTDLSKITGDSVKVMAEAAVAAAAPAVVKKGGWFISQVAAIALAIVMPLVGFFIGRGVERGAVAAVEAVSGGSGSGSAATPAPAASGSAATEAAPRALPYDAKTVAAEAVLGVPFDAHPAHPADAATAAEADAK
jgi:hypothetical protein